MYCRKKPISDIMNEDGNGKQKCDHQNLMMTSEGMT